MTDPASIGLFPSRLTNVMIQRTPMSAAPPALRFDARDTRRPGQRRDLTLLDVIEAIHELTDDDAESTAVLRALLRSGAVRQRAPRL